MGKLELKGLSVGYDRGPAIFNDLSLSVADGEIVSLLGPSGAGKTTILKTVAGLLPQRQGQIFIDGKCVDTLPAERRDTVLIFQKPLLFPFLNVYDNICFGLKMCGKKEAEIRAGVAKILAITGLEGFEKRRIHQLSGGQQQRVALARGLVLEPSVLLLDEPLSNLDAKLRGQMQQSLCEIQQQTGTTMLFVTHDQAEAFALSHRISVLLDGRLRQTATPKELFYRPADRDVAIFFGATNFIPGKISGGFFYGKDIKLPAPQPDCAKATLVYRPEDIRIVEKNWPQPVVFGKVVEERFAGSLTRLRVRLLQTTVTLSLPRPASQVGDEIALFFPPDKAHFLRD